MPQKVEQQTVTQKLEFTLNHDDVVRMMNDPNVMLGGGSVDLNQIMEIWVARGFGREKLLTDGFKDGDRVIFRFRNTIITEDTTELPPPDVPPQ
jgi:hypothetical protein